MTEIDSDRGRNDLLPYLFCALGVCLIVLLPIAFCVSLVLRDSQAKAAFLARSAEAQPVIDAVYLYHFEKGTWPDSLQDLKQPGIGALATEWERKREWEWAWEYNRVRDEARKTPYLIIYGPLHMHLKYTFRQEGDLASPGGWVAKSEGDPVRHNILERIPERPKSKAGN